jgi:photosystem II stability/assembly factor-like uncharacterized protein
MSNNYGEKMGKKLILVVLLPVFLLAFMQAEKAGGEVIGSNQGTPTAVKQVLALGDYVYYIPLVAKHDSSSAIDGTWQTVSSPTDAELISVAMASANEGWAVGWDNRMYGGMYGVILHYTNRAWQIVSSPTDAGLFSVAMVSAKYGWAVGVDGAILHYTNGVWQEVSSPTRSGLRSVSMVSASEGWAVGGDGTILHYTHHTWQGVSSPTTNDLYSVAMVSANEGWAVGENVILHYVNGIWQEVSRPLGTLNSVTMVSSNEGWAVGGWILPSGIYHLYYAKGMILHYTNGAWQEVNAPMYVAFSSVSMVSASEGWAVGEYCQLCFNADGHSVLLHYANGVWQEVSSPTWRSLHSVSMVSASEGWAVGEYGAILHYSP